MFVKVLSVVFFAIFFSVNALKIEIKKGGVKPDPIAIVDFFEKGGAPSSSGSEIASIVGADLESSGLFVLIDKSSFLESQQSIAKHGPNIKNWGVLNSRFLVYGEIGSGLGGFVINFTLIDVVTGEKMLSLEVKGPKAKLRYVAHTIADYIYKRITNEEGYFNTHLIIVETTYDKVSSHRKTRLVLIDQDGYNPRPLTDGDELVLTPRYASDGKSVAYISFNDKGKGVFGKSAHVYLIDPYSKARKLMISEAWMRKLIKKNNGNPVQMTYAPRFSPNNEEAVLAIIIDGKSAIYKISFVDNELIQLTQHTGIDTSPCFSADGKQIVFTSNRAGREAIWIMNADGSDPRKISSGDGKYSQPIFSPRGDLIACSKQIGGRFFIVIMKTDGSGERCIACGYLVEAPCWAPNGRYIVFSKQSGPGAKSHVEVVDITGHYVRLVKTQGDASHPAWSPSEPLAR
ncbi:MAG: Tol-Pal system protein TolB [Holosporales bacterium]|jgi:TolB protein|nr:Tol-Pal system protein TolB [Holosporales bacterium]